MSIYHFAVSHCNLEIVQFFTGQPSAFGFGMSDENCTRHAFRITHSLGLTILSMFLAVTAYSPSVIALNEMLKQQLLLTENFIAIQKHLHQNLIQHAQPDYSYTTLQDTKAVCVLVENMFVYICVCGCDWPCVLMPV